MKGTGLMDEVLVLRGALEDLAARRREGGEGPVPLPASPSEEPLGRLAKAADSLDAAAGSDALPASDAREAAELIRRAIARLRELA